MKKKPITKGEQFIYDWQYKRLAGFYSYLAQAIENADSHHQCLLSEGFPEEIEAYRRYTKTRGWWQEVELRIRNRNE